MQHDHPDWRDTLTAVVMIAYLAFSAWVFISVTFY